MWPRYRSTPCVAGGGDVTRGWFVTGTDTGVGKTLVSQALLRAFVNRGQRVSGMKPVASGCTPTPAGWRSADAVALLAAANVTADYQDVNPYAFEPATAPQLAATQAGVRIEIEVIRNCYATLAHHAEVVIVEGIGGWMVPINDAITMADVARALDLPVIMVVGLRLGAINHALLTEAAIRAQGCRLAGWVANSVDAEAPDGYLESLQQRLAAPLLGMIPHAASLDHAANLLDLRVL